MIDDLEDSIAPGSGNERREPSLVPGGYLFAEACEGQNLAAVLDPDANKTSLTFRAPGCWPTGLIASLPGGFGASSEPRLLSLLQSPQQPCSALEETEAQG